MLPLALSLSAYELCKYPKYPAQPDKVIALVVANIAICTCAHDLTSLNMSWMQNLAQIHCFYII